jgi:hypothetical protein
MARHKGKALKKTRKPDKMSWRKFCTKPAHPVLGMFKVFVDAGAEAVNVADMVLPTRNDPFKSRSASGTASATTTTF